MTSRGDSRPLQDRPTGERKCEDLTHHLLPLAGSWCAAGEVPTPAGRAARVWMRAGVPTSPRRPRRPAPSGCACVRSVAVRTPGQEPDEDPGLGQHVNGSSSGNHAEK